MAKIKRHSRGYYAEVGDPEEIDKIVDGEFNPVKLENEELLPEEEKVLEEARIKKTFPFDRARLEFLRMQIGPVKNFFQTLDNVLVSISERLGALEEELLKLKVKDNLWEEYYSHMNEQQRFVSVDEFILHLKKKEEESNASKKS